MIETGGFLGKPFSLLLRTGLPLMKNLIKPLAQSFLIPLGLLTAAAAAAAVYVGKHKKS